VATDHTTSVLLEYLGDEAGAARGSPRRPRPPALVSAWEQLLIALQIVVEAGWVHADLSAYNLLWWRDQVWLIDVPQAVDLHRSTIGYELLHRDLQNVSRWFTAHGVPVDADATLAVVLR
jgi:RIO kinase 1